MDNVGANSGIRGAFPREGASVYWESGGGLEPWEGGHHVARSQWFSFLPFAGVTLFLPFVFCSPTRCFLVIDCLGIGFVLFVDTIILDVLVLV